MAATQNPDSADTALDHLEAALESIARSLRARKPAAAAIPPQTLHVIEQRLDAAIDHINTVLGRKADS
jgi:hypothetical protein